MRARTHASQMFHVASGRAVHVPTTHIPVPGVPGKALAGTHVSGGLPEAPPSVTRGGGGGGELTGGGGGEGEGEGETSSPSPLSVGGGGGDAVSSWPPWSPHAPQLSRHTTVPTGWLRYTQPAAHWPLFAQLLQRAAWSEQPVGRVPRTSGKCAVLRWKLKACAVELWRDGMCSGQGGAQEDG